MNKGQITRRQFMAGSAVAATGLVVGVHVGKAAADIAAGVADVSPNAWLVVTTDHQIIFRLDKVEMGQGVYTGLTTLVAEELEVDPRTLTIEHAPMYQDFQSPFQVTGGSESTRSRWVILRETGARTKAVLVQAAANQWGVDPSECTVDNGVVYHTPSHQSLRYGDLALAASKLPLPEQVTLKNPADYKYLGKPLRRFDATAKSTGRAEFGIDVSLPGMVNAVVLRNPHFGGAKLPRYSPDEALGAAGVLQVLEISSGVAVVADTYWHARKAAALINPEWDKGPLGDVSSESIQQHRMTLFENEEGRELRRDGEGRDALAGAASTVEAVYEVPYQAHATMEPQNATVRVAEDGEVTVWCPNQAPDIVQALVAESLNIERTKVCVHTTLLGGGFGRRGIPDYAVEAAEIAAAVPGTPVKLIWSREDDLQHDYYRPATSNRMRAGTDASGKVTTWDQTMISPSVMSHFMRALGGIAPNWVPDSVVSGLTGVAGYFLQTRDPTSHSGVVDHEYDFANIQANQIFDDPGIPLGIWRSVGDSQNAFVKEGFIDELAHLEGIDPLAYRRQKLRNSPRQLEVLNLAAEKANWSSPPEGVFQGIAVQESFGTAVAEVAEVRLDASGNVVLERIVCAVNCGFALNPDLVKAQIESGVIYGLTAALKNPITIVEGRVAQSNFHDFELLRLQEAPRVEVYILPASTEPTGVGEPGVPPVAPAVANAIFAATGVRQRSLPLRLSAGRPTAPT